MSSKCYLSELGQVVKLLKVPIRALQNSTLKEGSFSCECYSGFVESFDDCLDIDECSLSINTCDRETSTCINTMGAFNCQCLPGYGQLVTVQKI